MKISLGQMQVVIGDYKTNLNLAIKMIQQSKKEESSLILFPEVFATGFDYENLKKISAKTPYIIDTLLKFSDNFAICGSLLNLEGQQIFNTFYCLYNGEIVFKYSKIKLFQVTNEDKYFSAGSRLQENTFELFGVKFGVAICYELRFPEFFRKAALKGNQIMLLSAIWPIQRLKHWQILSQARAIENQFYFACANAVKMSGKWVLGGNSTIYDPNGGIMTNAKDEICVKTIEINPQFVQKVRNEFPSLKSAYDLYN